MNTTFASASSKQERLPGSATTRENRAKEATRQNSDLNSGKFLFFLESKLRPCTSPNCQQNIFRALLVSAEQQGEWYALRHTYSSMVKTNVVALVACLCVGLVRSLPHGCPQSMGRRVYRNVNGLGSVEGRSPERQILEALRGGGKTDDGESQAQHLCQAAAEGNLNQVKEMINLGADVNWCNHDKRSGLHLAASEGQSDMVLYLLQHGANPHRRDKYGNLPLDDARRGNASASSLPAKRGDYPKEFEKCVEYLLTAMPATTLRGKASKLYSKLLSRNHDRYGFVAWGEMMSRNAHQSAVAYDTDNCGRGQIIEYDPAYLSVFGWYTNFKGTIFEVPVIHFQFAILVCISVIYSLICREPSEQNPNPSFPVFKGQTFGVGVVGGLLGFLLALFNGDGLNRWWATRQSLGMLMGKMVDFGAMIATYLRNGETDEAKQECREAREDIFRWLNLAHILVYRQARNQHDISDLVNDERYDPPRAWITQKEWFILQGRTMTHSERMSQGDIEDVFQRFKVLTPKIKPEQRGKRMQANLFFAAQDLLHVKNKLLFRSNTVLYWIERKISECAAKGLFVPWRIEKFSKMEVCLSDMRMSILGLFTCLYSKIPYIYMQLLTCLVKLYLFVIAIVAGSSLRQANATIDLILPILLVFVANCAYEGIMQIHVRLWNPLGTDTSGFPVSKYLQFVWKSLEQLKDDDQDVIPWATKGVNEVPQAFPNSDTEKKSDKTEACKKVDEDGVETADATVLSVPAAADNSKSVREKKSERKSEIYKKADDAKAADATVLSVPAAADRKSAKTLD